MSGNGRLHLIFDADDTLWENNIYFEAAFDRFYEFLRHSHLTARQVRDVLDDIERTNAKLYGYGSKNFARNLAECYQHLSEHDISPEDLATVQSYAYDILEQPIELIDGVAETLCGLHGRHQLTVFTKGDPDEQKMKVDRSGLAHYFDHIEIVREKNERAYRDLADARSFSYERTWMIGNSPKSDINPALAAGLNAVFVPHPRTWILEHEEVPEQHPRLIRVESVRELQRIF